MKYMMVRRDTNSNIFNHHKPKKINGTKNKTNEKPNKNKQLNPIIPRLPPFLPTFQIFP